MTLLGDALDLVREERRRQDADARGAGEGVGRERRAAQ